MLRPATYLRLEVTVDNIEAVQVGEGEHDLRCVQLPLVVGKSAYWRVLVHVGACWCVVFSDEHR